MNTVASLPAKLLRAAEVLSREADGWDYNSRFAADCREAEAAVREAAAALAAPVGVDEQWRGIFKVIEECGELLQVLGKLGPFPNAPHPDGKGDLRERAEDELADLAAATGYFITINGLNMDRIQPRAESKRDKFRAWGLTGIAALAGKEGA